MLVTVMETTEMFFVTKDWKNCLKEFKVHKRSDHGNKTHKELSGKFIIASYVLLASEIHWKTNSAFLNLLILETFNKLGVENSIYTIMEKCFSVWLLFVFIKVLVLTDMKT